MWKIVQKEYVGIEDFLEIAENAHALMEKGHYVSVEMSNLCKVERVQIKIMLDGWDTGKNYDFDFSFFVSDEEKEVAKMNDCRSILNELLEEE